MLLPSARIGQVARRGWDRGGLVREWLGGPRAGPAMPQRRRYRASNVATVGLVLLTSPAKTRMVIIRELCFSEIPQGKGSASCRSQKLVRSCTVTDSNCSAYANDPDISDAWLVSGTRRRHDAVRRSGLSRVARPYSGPIANVMTQSLKAANKGGLCGSRVQDRIFAAGGNYGIGSGAASGRRSAPFRHA